MYHSCIEEMPPNDNSGSLAAGAHGSVVATASARAAVPAQPLRVESWFNGAKAAGAWLVDTEGNLLRGFTRGGDIRWNPDIFGPHATPREVTCIPASTAAWAILDQPYSSRK